MQAVENIRSVCAKAQIEGVEFFNLCATDGTVSEIFWVPAVESVEDEVTTVYDLLSVLTDYIDKPENVMAKDSEHFAVYSTFTLYLNKMYNALKCNSTNVVAIQNQMILAQKIGMLPLADPEDPKQPEGGSFECLHGEFYEMGDALLIAAVTGEEYEVVASRQPAAVPANKEGAASAHTPEEEAEASAEETTKDSAAAEDPAEAAAQAKETAAADSQTPAEDTESSAPAENNVEDSARAKQTTIQGSGQATTGENQDVPSQPGAPGETPKPPSPENPQGTVSPSADDWGTFDETKKNEILTQLASAFQQKSNHFLCRNLLKIPAGKRRKAWDDLAVDCTNAIYIQTLSAALMEKIEALLAAKEVTAVAEEAASDNSHENMTVTQPEQRARRSNNKRRLDGTHKTRT